MTNAKKLNVKAFTVKIILTVITAVLSNGCDEQLDRMEINQVALQEHQFKLQEQMEYNLQGTDRNSSEIQINEQELKSIIESNTNTITQDITVMEQYQEVLRGEVTMLFKQTVDLCQQMVMNVKVINDNQSKLQREIEDNTQHLSRNILAVENNVSDLRETINNNQSEYKKTNAKVITIENNQLKLRTDFLGKLQQISSTLREIEQNLTELKRLDVDIQNKIKTVIGKMDMIEKRQDKTRGKLKSTAI